jgi:hypothetical protein
VSASTLACGVIRYYVSGISTSRAYGGHFTVVPGTTSISVASSYI